MDTTRLNDIGIGTPISPRVFLAFAATAIITGFLTTTAASEEFRPLKLPQQSVSPYQQYQPPPQQTQQGVDEAIYENFAREVSGMTAKRKKKLIANFSAKRDRAIRNRQADQSLHYQRLLEILKK
ncbi:hypothetical protein [Geobacter sp. AOG1]|uniref:hypothetical protein n=1 Tax=Geobacter sp. AOG1 TaxID=1566346 RepID=UPI001CC611A6|nr:hypothetical protein [Geobacter sp. AOG1]GFE59170.1 hypothetical protein AOG1_30500 [Geobacter sp. AOG1]